MPEDVRFSAKGPLKCEYALIVQYGPSAGSRRDEAPPLD